MRAIRGEYTEAPKMSEVKSLGVGEGGRARGGEEAKAATEGRTKLVGEEGGRKRLSLSLISQDKVINASTYDILSIL